ncbi:MAG: DUF268 domain-containing protein [Nitrospinales bacterium]
MINYLTNKVKKSLEKFRFKNEFDTFSRLALRKNNRFPVKWRDRYPCLDDNTPNTVFDRHYVYHTSWAARILAKTMPEYHVDISSDLRFVTLVSAFVPIRFYDYRPAELNLDNLTLEHTDITQLSFEDDSIGSLSCMHVVEHIGLGRYGDSLDFDGDLKAIAELNRVLAAKGDLLFAVPIGEPKIMFNAHRIYSYDQVLEYFKGLELVEFSLVPDHPNDGSLIKNASKAMADAQEYGCGCFWFQKEG